MTTRHLALFKKNSLIDVLDTRFRLRCNWRVAMGTVRGYLGFWQEPLSRRFPLGCAVVIGALLVAATPAFADKPRNDTVELGESQKPKLVGEVNLAKKESSQDGGTTAATGATCLAYVWAQYSGLVGTPKTIKFNGLRDCEPPVPPLIDVSGVAQLYDAGFRWEATGNNCYGLYDCQSSGSFYAPLSTYPGSQHIINYNDTMTILDSNWYWTGSDSNCVGYGTQLLRCSYNVSIQVPL